MDRRRRGVRFVPCLRAIGAAAGYRPVGAWSCGRQERRDLKSNAIEPLACFGSLLRGFWPEALDLARCLRKPAAHFDLGCCKTRLRLSPGPVVSLRAQCLRGAGSTHALSGRMRILSHVLRHAAHLRALRALCWTTAWFLMGGPKSVIRPSMQPPIIQAARAACGPHSAP